MSCRLLIGEGGELATIVSDVRPVPDPTPAIFYPPWASGASGMLLCSPLVAGHEASAADRTAGRIEMPLSVELV